MKKALILVDLENEWIDKTSDYYVGDISKLIDRTNKLIEFCRKNDYKIIFVTHIEKDSKTAFVENSKNVEIIKEIKKLKSDILIKKNKISPFYKTNLENELKEIKDITICGILTNLCVRSLAQDAYDREFNITIIKDCCTALDSETHEFTLKDLKTTREEINIIDSKELIQKP